MKGKETSASSDRQDHLRVATVAGLSVSLAAFVFSYALFEEAGIAIRSGLFVLFVTFGFVFWFVARPSFGPRFLVGLGVTLLGGVAAVSPIIQALVDVWTGDFPAAHVLLTRVIEIAAERSLSTIDSIIVGMAFFMVAGGIGLAGWQAYLDRGQPAGQESDNAQSEAKRKFHTPVPELEHKYYLARLGVLATLTDKLRSANGFALVGMGGLGKSTIAKALVQTEYVQSEFEKVRWIPVGQSVDGYGLQNLISEQISGHGLVSERTSEGRMELQAGLQGGKTLLILDDVWDVELARAIPEPGPDWKLVITTRHRDVAERFQLSREELPPLEQTEALSLLRQFAEHAAYQGDPDPIEMEILDRAHGLPLALAMIGSMAREAGHQYWGDILERLKSSNLAKIGADLVDYESYQSLLGSIEASVSYLPDPLQSRFRDLVILPKNMPVPLATLKLLWGGVDQLEAQQVASALASRALGSFPTDEHFALHDLHLDFLRGTIDIHDLESRHRGFAERLRTRALDDWVTDPLNQYFFERLTYHFNGGRAWSELESLLTSYEWVSSKLEASGIARLLEDYNQLENAESMVGEIASADKQHVTRDDVTLIANALRHSRSILAAHPNCLADQLGARLTGLSGGLDEFVGSFQIQSPLKLISPTVRKATDPLRLVLREHVEQEDPRLPNMIFGMSEVHIDTERHLALGTDEFGGVWIWNTRNGEFVRRTNTECGRVITKSAVSSDSILLATDECKLCELDLETLEMTSIGHEGCVTTMGGFGDGQVLAFSKGENEQHTLSILDSSNWTVASEYDLPVREEAREDFEELFICPDQEHFFVAKGRTLWRGQLSELSELTLVRTFEWTEDPGIDDRLLITGIAVSPDNQSVAVALNDGHIYVFDHATEKVVERKALSATKSQGVNTIVFAGNDKLVSAGWDGTLRVSTIPELDEVAVFMHPSKLFSLTVSKDNQLAMVGQKFDGARIWNIAGHPQSHLGLSGAVTELWGVNKSDVSLSVGGSFEDSALMLWHKGKSLTSLVPGTDILASNYNSATNTIFVVRMATAEDFESRALISTYKLEQSNGAWDIRESGEPVMLDGVSSYEKLVITEDGATVVRYQDDLSGGTTIWAASNQWEPIQVSKLDELGDSFGGVITVDRTGANAWAASVDALARVDLVTKEIELVASLEGLVESDIHSLVADSDGYVGVGHESGWHYLDVKSGQWRSFSSDSTTDALSLSSDSIVAFGGVDGGLHIWDRKSEQLCASFFIDEGLSAVWLSEDSRRVLLGDTTGRVHEFELTL